VRGKFEVVKAEEEEGGCWSKGRSKQSLKTKEKDIWERKI